MDVQARPLHGIDSYQDWVKAEGLPFREEWAIDLFALETADWPRYGVKGAAAHLKGRGDFCNIFVIELPAGKSTLPQRHLYEEVVYVLEGRGSTQLEFTDGSKRSFEWGPRSLFAIPLNAKHRHFNASGTERALLAATTNLPIVLNMFHNDAFIFDNDFIFSDRVGKEKYYSGDGDLIPVRPGNNMWETNFVADLASIELTEWGDRGGGGSNIMFVLAGGSMHAHLSEMPAGTYKKGHRHGPGYHVMCVVGTGFSLLWFEDDRDFMRIDWKHGVVFPPAAQQFHQHFGTSAAPARYLATGLGGVRYPVTQDNMRSFIGTGPRQGVSLSIKDGGDQIEYADQDPRIHSMWLAEMKKQNIAPHMEKYIQE